MRKVSLIDVTRSEKNESLSRIIHSVAFSPFRVRVLSKARAVVRMRHAQLCSSFGLRFFFCVCVLFFCRFAIGGDLVPPLINHN